MTTGDLGLLMAKLQGCYSILQQTHTCSQIFSEIWHFEFISFVDTRTGKQWKQEKFNYALSQTDVLKKLWKGDYSTISAKLYFAGRSCSSNGQWIAGFDLYPL